MATLQLFAGVPQVNWRETLLDALTDGTFTTTGTGLASVVLKSGANVVTIEGSGFDVVTGARTISGGTVTKVTLTVGGTQVATFDGFDSPPTAASIQSLLNAPPADIWSMQAFIAYEPMTIIGSDAKDELLGSAFDDTIHLKDIGPRTGDYVRPGLGINTLLVTEVTEAGGARGGHLLAFVDLTVAVNVDLGAGTATAAGMSTTFSDIKYVSTGHGSDVLKGSTNDIVYEAFVGNGGNDNIDGGVGGFDLVFYDDEVDYGAATAGGWANGNRGAIVNLATGTAQDSYGDTDTLANIEGVIGSKFADSITGNSQANYLFGKEANDTLKGGGGKDTLDGGSGKDKITGGGGRDTLNGGTEKDVFIFKATTDSGKSATKRDLINDFKRNADDIDLSAIDADSTASGNQEFVLDARGSASTAVATGHIGWYKINKAGTADDRTIIKVNVDNDSTIEMQIELVGLVNLTTGDFIL